MKLPNSYLHRVSFTSPCLSIGEDGTIVPFEDSIQNRNCTGFENADLSASFIKGVIIGVENWFLLKESTRIGG